jgi:hypothetical protein
MGTAGWKSWALEGRRLSTLHAALQDLDSRVFSDLLGSVVRRRSSKRAFTALAPSSRGDYQEMLSILALP